MVCRKLPALTSQALVLMLSLVMPAAAQIYQWRDADGRLHFSDTPADGMAAEPAVERPGTAVPPGARTGLLRIEQQDFALSPTTLERVRRGLDGILSLYTRELGLDVRGEVVVRLHLLASVGDYQRWTRERTGIAPPRHSTGVYVTRTREVAVWQWGDEDSIASTILHEASHVILAQLAPRAPSWLHEGLAQYVQMIEVDGGRLVIPPHPAIHRVRAWQQDGTLISLRRYLNLPEQEWRQLAHDQSAIPYTVAWATVYFMMSSPVGKQTLRRLLHDMEKSGQWPDANTIDGRYPGGLVKMDYDFFRWAQGDIRPHHY